MNYSCTHLAYSNTGYFSKIVSDYLQQLPELQPFYKYSPDINGIKKAIEARKVFQTPRALLVEVLQEQYAGLNIAGQVKDHIAALGNENCFTVVTAHQPNIFTGPLYFIYKLLHTIKLAEELQAAFPENKFIPVYYMGSEDADLDELGYINVDGQKLIWQTKQTGAVGRMKVDKALTGILHAMEGQVGVLPYGNELIGLFRQFYTEGKTIQQATLELVNALFGHYGLLVLIPDNAKLKKPFQPVVTRELLEGFSHKAVAATIAALGKNYKVQAAGREINLFYLVDDKRERIEMTGTRYEIRVLGLSFSREEILQELELHPERFSANVILRGAFQETILPNIAFIGGGGELAYWLELKAVFETLQVPYPVLMLRNSFLVMKEEQAARISRLGLSHPDLFRDADTLFNELVKRGSGKDISLAEPIRQANEMYENLKKKAGGVNSTLQQHTEALQAKAVKRMQQLEKKMLRAEKEKFETEKRQLHQLKQQLFPGNSLQERVENMSTWYAAYGKEWIDMLYKASAGLRQEFCIVTV